MTECLSNTHTPGSDGVLTGLPGQQGLLYDWVRVLAGGGTSEFSEIRMRGPIYDQNGVQIVGGGGGGGSLATLSDVQFVPPVQNFNILYYNGGLAKWSNAPFPTIPNNLNDLNDVTIAGQANGQRFVYDSAVAQWINRYANRIFVGLSGVSQTILPNTNVTLGVGMNQYDTSGGGMGYGDFLAVTVDRPGVYQYHVIVEASGTNPDNASVQLEINGVPYGPVYTQAVKSGDRIEFLLHGCFTQTGPSTLNVRYTSSGGHNIVVHAGSFYVSDM